MASRKNLQPGDLVLGLGDNARDTKMRSGVIVAVDYEAERECHYGCEHRLLVLWAEPTPHLVRECDCGILVPLDLGL